MTLILLSQNNPTGIKLTGGRFSHQPCLPSVDNSTHP